MSSVKILHPEAEAALKPPDDAPLAARLKYFINLVDGRYEDLRRGDWRLNVLRDFMVIRALKPDVLFITCAHARAAPDLLGQSDAGEFFICCNIGNIVPPFGEFPDDVSSSIEYALAMSVRSIVVVGHSDCAAMEALLNPEGLASMASASKWLRHAQEAAAFVAQNFPHTWGDEPLRAVTEKNVLVQMDHLRTHPSVAARLSSGQLELQGWVYNHAAAEIAVWNPVERRFLPWGETRGLQ